MNDEYIIDNLRQIAIPVSIHREERATDGVSPLFNGFRSRVVVSEDLAMIMRWQVGDIES